MVHPGGWYELRSAGAWCTAAGGINSRLSALGSQYCLHWRHRAELSALATVCGDPVRPSICRCHAPRGTPPSHSRGRHPRLRRGHRPSAARRGIGPSRPGGRAVSRPIRPWCAVTASTASLVAYSAGKSLRLKPRPRPPSRVNRFLRRISYKEVLHESNAYNFTTSIGIPRTTCKSDEFDEYEVSPTRPAPSTAVPRAPSRTGANRARASRATGGTRGESRPMRIGVRPGAGAVPGALHHGAELED